MSVQSGVESKPTTDSISCEDGEVQLEEGLATNTKKRSLADAFDTGLRDSDDDDGYGIGAPDGRYCLQWVRKRFKTNTRCGGGERTVHLSDGIVAAVLQWVVLSTERLSKDDVFIEKNELLADYIVWMDTTRYAIRSDIEDLWESLNVTSVDAFLECTMDVDETQAMHIALEKLQKRGFHVTYDDIADGIWVKNNWC